MAASKSVYGIFRPVGLDNLSFPATESQLVIIFECAVGLERVNIS